MLKLRQMLGELGLSPHEAAVYSVLVGFERISAAALAEPSGIDRSHVYAALNRLIARGLVNASRGRVRLFSAVEPEEALGALLDKKRRSLADCEKVVSEIARRHTRRRQFDKRPAHVEVLAGSSNGSFAEIRTRLAGAKKEILSIIGREAFPDQRGKSLKADRLQQSALRRGVPSRCVYSDELLQDEFERKRLRASVRAGEQARVVPELPFDLLIVDDDLAVFSSPDGDGRFTNFRINDPKMVGVYRLAFEQLWAGAGPADRYLKER